jgi:hypothetical protein
LQAWIQSGGALTDEISMTRLERRNRSYLLVFERVVPHRRTKRLDRRLGSIITCAYHCRNNKEGHITYCWLLLGEYDAGYATSELLVC